MGILRNRPYRSSRFYNDIIWTRDIVAVAYSSVTSVGNKGTVSYLLEDSWPRLRVVLGWCWQAEDAVEVVLSLADTHLSYADTVDKELNGLVMKVGPDQKIFLNNLKNIWKHL